MYNLIGVIILLRVIFERPETGNAISVVAKISVGKGIIPDLWSSILFSMAELETPTVLGYTSQDAGVALTFYSTGFIVRIVSTIDPRAVNRTYINLFGNYNFDNIKIISSFNNRVEVRNENFVLITDNGLPWSDGTYPPDAKNRAGLTGLNAAPVASTNEFADLSELDPNKEEEITVGERGAGVQHALDKETGDNGF